MIRVFQLTSVGALTRGLGLFSRGGSGAVGYVALMAVNVLRRGGGKLGAAGDELLECLVFFYKIRDVLGKYIRCFHGKYSV